MHLSAKHLVLSSTLALGCAVAAGQAATAVDQQIPPQSPDSQAASSVLAKANAGDVAAQIAVGESYLAGNGVDRDCKQAGDWFRKAAGKGAVAGELRLAKFFRDGATGCPRDLVQAAAWYRKAAEQGDVEAQGLLGTLYSFGQGVAQDYVEAYFWLNLAASVVGPEQAHYAANRQMVGVHLTTDEVAQVEERTAKWKAVHPR